MTAEMNAKSSKRRNIPRSFQFFTLTVHFPQILAKMRHETSSQSTFEVDSRALSNIAAKHRAKLYFNFADSRSFPQQKRKVALWILSVYFHTTARSVMSYPLHKIMLERKLCQSLANATKHAQVNQTSAGRCLCEGNFSSFKTRNVTLAKLAKNTSHPNPNLFGALW